MTFSTDNTPAPTEIAFQTSYYRDPAAGTAASVDAAPAKSVKTKEERIAAYREQIVRLEAKISDLINGREPVAKAPKIVPLPEVGAFVTFTYGRKTATSNPEEKSGVVVAVKPSATQVLENGIERKTPAQVKVQVGEGFDAEFCVIFPAQILAKPTEDNFSA